MFNNLNHNNNGLLYFYLGIVFIQSFFVLYQYFISKRIEFVYYLLYVFFITILITFQWLPSMCDYLKLVTPSGLFFLARASLIFALAFYYGFGRHFCNMNSLYVKQNLFQLKLEKFMMAFAIFDTLTSLIYKDYFLPDIYVKFFIVFLMLYSIYIIWFLATRKNILNSILVTGSSFLLLGGIIYAIEYVRTENSYSGDYYMQFYIYGVILEFLFLNFGLIYKSKLINEAYQNQLQEKQFQFETQRNQLVDDLQDEVGGGLSTIRMSSEMQLLDKQLFPKQAEVLKQIIDTTEHISKEMKNIVWSLNTKNDNLENTIEYIVQYAFASFEMNNIQLKVLNKISNAHSISINGLSRKNIVSICKEIIEYISTQLDVQIVLIHIQHPKNELQIRISYKGNSIEKELTAKNSIMKMQKLIDEIHGRLYFENNNGYIIHIYCSLNN